MKGSRKYGDFEDKVVHTLEENKMLNLGQVAKSTKDLKVQVKELFDRVAFPDGVTLDDPLRLIVELVIPTNIVGEMFHSNVKKIWECLMRNEVSRIGICGMGGVGKTTLVQYVHNKVLENCSTFGNVYWVTVSRDCSIYKLQNEIANIIAEDLLNGVDDEFKRAGLLAKALKKKEKFVLFLDDMWNNFDLNKVGILENVECKLVLTARSKDVCRRMGCDENNIIQVDPLSEENAWNLFVEYYSTHYIQPHIEDIAKQVVKECSGLPLGIITLARSMRGTEDIREWKDILRKLKRSETGLKSIEVISRKDDVESAMKVEIQLEDEEESKRRKMRNEDVGQRVIFGLGGIGKTIIANKNSTSAIKFDKVVIEEEKCPNKSESANKEESKEKGKERKSKRKGEAKANEKKVIFGMGGIGKTTMKNTDSTSTITFGDIQI